MKSSCKVHCRICTNCRSSEYLALYVLANIAMFNLKPIAIDFIDEILSECSVVLLSLCSDCNAEVWHRIAGIAQLCKSYRT